MARKNWLYSDASVVQAGLMICCSCNKKITVGEFRYRDAGEKYIIQHRSCSSQDPIWAEMDKKRQKQTDRENALRIASESFFKRWGITDIQDYIDT